MTPALHDPVAQAIEDQKKQIEQLQQRLADLQEAATLLATDQSSLQEYTKLRQEGNESEAAELMFELGREIFQSGDFALAENFFTHVLRLNPQTTLVYWYLADTLRILATIAEPPYVDRAVLQRALEVWHKGYRLAPLEADDSWAYVVRAQLADLQSQLEENPNPYYWEAVCYIERAILLEANDYYRWTMLARYYRFLALDHTALQATEQALQYNTSDSLVLAERAGVLINLGRAIEARKVLDQLLKIKSLDPQDKYIYTSWKALAHFYLKQYQKAIDLLTTVLVDGREDLWARGVRADNFRVMERTEEARADYETIWLQRDNPDYARFQLNFSEAAFYLGHYEESIKINQQLLSSRGDSFYASLSLSECYLALGNFIAADQYFQQVLQKASNNGEMDYASVMYASLEILSRQQNWPQAETALHRIKGKNGYLHQLAAQKKKLAQQELSGTDELQAILAETPPKSEWTVVAALASLGRLQAEAGNAPEAIASYQRLNQYSTQFPDALRLFLTAHLQLAAPLDWAPTVTPILIDIAPAMLPQEENWEKWPIFKTYIPALRQRLKQEFGMQIPGVRLRGDALPDNSYVISLDEVPLRLGRWEAPRICCLASFEQLKTIGVPANDTAQVPFLLANQMIFWVDSQHDTLLRRHNIRRVEDPLEFIVYHLESIIQDNLASFLDNQEVLYLLEEWRREPKNVALIEAVVANDTNGPRLGRVLRALVNEKAPITNSHALLTAVINQGLPNEDIHEALIAARLAIKPDLHGNQPGMARFPLPQHFETTLRSWVRSQDGKWWLAIAPDVIQNLLDQVRNEMSSMPDKAALVVQDVHIRPFVKRMIELEYPHLPVLAQSEVLTFSPNTVDPV